MNAMNASTHASSKVTQKVVTLILLTAAIVVPSELGVDRFVKAAPEVSFQETHVGKVAPAFELKDTNGKTWNLKEQKGKIVVLEWFNFGCPFVKKHYGSGNMQKLQKEMTGKSIVWLSICSSAPGKQGYAEPTQQAKDMKDKGGAPAAVLIDQDGKVGHLYGAKTTPDMYVIDKNGSLVYAGAIDDKNGFGPDEIATAKNYVRAAVDEILAGKQVTVAETKPYGCSVKYQ